MKAVPISIGVCTVLLASACSSSLTRDTPPQQALARSQYSQSKDALAPAQGENVDRSQTDVDDAMRKRGYKPMVYRGERVYCRNEALTGSNLESKVCLTAKQIEDLEQSGKDILNRNRQAGCLPTMKSGCD
jgi:hypothetical protein